MSSPLSKLKEIIGKVAPTIGTAIGGPLGGVAGTMIQEILGVSSEQAAYEALKKNPDALLKLKEAELKFQEFVIKADIDLASLEVQDRSSARELFKVNIWPQITLSGLFISGYFATLYLVMNGIVQPPQELRETMILLLGILAAEVPRIMNFWFGSSLGSREKTAKMVAQ